ncbi:TetR/AcrR family transcriptional regulator [Actinoplanes sp. NPDC051851]|uniref:TetR/AcrR family transcriptional regulator n=1 Tax=Actinoplanes sp. NPDC051851 TaxID=3154753 RepID=UPI0034152902
MAGRKQFDVDVALGRAMHVFWEHGYDGASLDLLTTATGLGRGSLYGTFGGKDELFRKALDQYSGVYGPRYESALAGHPGDPGAAVAAFFEVVLARIGDPGVPDGCLVVQSAAQSPNLSEPSAEHVRGIMGLQWSRIRAALDRADVPGGELDDLATYVLAVNQSLAVLSRAGTPMADLRTVARIASETVTHRMRAAATGNG